MPAQSLPGHLDALSQPHERPPSSGLPRLKRFRNRRTSRTPNPRRFSGRRPLETHALEGLRTSRRSPPAATPARKRVFSETRPGHIVPRFRTPYHPGSDAFETKAGDTSPENHTQLLDHKHRGERDVQNQVQLRVWLVTRRDRWRQAPKNALAQPQRPPRSRAILASHRRSRWASPFLGFFCAAASRRALASRGLASKGPCFADPLGGPSGSQFGSSEFRSKSLLRCNTAGLSVCGPGLRR